MVCWSLSPPNSSLVFFAVSKIRRRWIGKRKNARASEEGDHCDEDVGSAE